MKNLFHITIICAIALMAQSCAGPRCATKSVPAEETNISSKGFQVVTLPDGTELIYHDGVLLTEAQAQQMQQQQNQQAGGAASGMSGAPCQTGSNAGQMQAPQFSNIYVGMTIYSNSRVVAEDYKCDAYGNPISSSSLKSKTASNLSATWVDQLGMPVAILNGAIYIPGFQAWMDGSGTEIALNSNAPIKWRVVSVAYGRVQLALG